jgi:hypothetical protein
MSHGDSSAMPPADELTFVHSAMKSAWICDFITLLLSKSTTYSDSSITHLLILPELPVAEDIIQWLVG